MHPCVAALSSGSVRASVSGCFSIELEAMDVLYLEQRGKLHQVSLRSTLLAIPPAANGAIRVKIS